MEECRIENLYNLEQTIAKDIFEGVTYPWEVLPKIEEFIISLGKTLDKNEYEEKGENIWIAKSAKVAPTAYIAGPAIIGKNAEIRHCAFVRGKAIEVEVGCGSVLNPGTVIGKHTNIYPLSSVRGVVPEHSIYKNKNEIVEKID